MDQLPLLLHAGLTDAYGLPYPNLPDHQGEGRNGSVKQESEGKKQYSDGPHILEAHWQGSSFGLSEFTLGSD